MLHLASVGVSMIPRLKTLIQCVFLLYFKSFNYVHFNLKMYYATKKMDIICNSFCDIPNLNMLPSNAFYRGGCVVTLFDDDQGSNVRHSCHTFSVCNC